MGAYEDMTAKIVAAIEKAQATSGRYKMPWHSQSGRPVNVQSGKAYGGINTLMLWGEQQDRGFRSSLWGTFKQWQGKGARVSKGANASLVVFWRNLPRKGEQEPVQDGQIGTADKRFILKTSLAFNADQVEGYGEEQPEPVAHEPCAAERLVQDARVDVRFVGSKAFYHPKLDYVQLPPMSDFVSVPAFQSVLLHEAAHWTGHENRLGREFGKRFGDNAYAVEELVAELTAAFLCADLGVSNEPRLDHAQYVADWLQVLKNDTRAIFSAASAATKAANFLLDFQKKEKIGEIAA